MEGQHSAAVDPSYVGDADYNAGQYGFKDAVVDKGLSQHQRGLPGEVGKYSGLSLHTAATVIINSNLQSCLF